MDFISIKDNTEKVLKGLPEGVELVAAAKTRTAEEIMEAVNAGVKIIGENYVQEAKDVFSSVGRNVKWHFIGHLQKNKVRKAVEIFDTIETVDSFALASEIDKKCGEIGKKMTVFIEINSGKEKQKFGVLPEKALSIIKEISGLSNIRVKGLMTMGPFSGEAEEARPYFSETKALFFDIEREGIENIEMKYLSMGMTNSYLVAIQEGANMVRIGTKIFGDRR
ncbi:MAG: YggS family pyridoxal phosphate-dependent enzyme [Candidatus Omnitrophota bacterium]